MSRDYVSFSRGWEQALKGDYPVVLLLNVLEYLA